MIREINKVFLKYKEISKKSEYVSVGEVTNDLYQLLQECRIKRMPKHLR